MRLDKFLKVSRIIKRRTVAKEASSTGKIKVNGKVAKPSTNLEIDDLITIKFYKKTITVKVLALETSTKKEDAEKMYEVVSVIEST